MGIVLRNGVPGKVCPACTEWHPLDQFHKDRTTLTGYSRLCRVCNNAVKRERYQQDQGRQQERSRDYMRLRRQNDAAYQERQREYLAGYREQHRDTARAYGMGWREANQDKVKANEQVRRAREMGASGSFTPSEWRALCAYYGNRCLACGADDRRLTPDHVVPLARGGSNDIGNIQPLCLSCNHKKKDRVIDYRPPRP